MLAGAKVSWPGLICVPTIGNASLGPSPTGSGACFEGDLLSRMDENRRADFDRRPFLLHLNQDDSAGMHHKRKNERCDDCPFVRRFVYRCGRHHVPP